MGPVTVLMPVKAFAEGKGRLASALDGAPRSALARAMADNVLSAAGDLPVAVVCDDAEVAEWARTRGATVIDEPGRGLNGAVARGVERLVSGGARSVIVAHADLPLARDLAWVAQFRGITLVPDRRDDGTNVLCLPADMAAEFCFAYGPGSFRAHGN